MHLHATQCQRAHGGRAGQHLGQIGVTGKKHFVHGDPLAVGLLAGLRTQRETADLDPFAFDPAGRFHADFQIRVMLGKPPLDMYANLLVQLSRQELTAHDESGSADQDRQQHPAHKAAQASHESTLLLHPPGFLSRMHTISRRTASYSATSLAAVAPRAPPPTTHHHRCRQHDPGQHGRLTVPNRTDEDQMQTGEVHGRKPTQHEQAIHGVPRSRGRCPPTRKQERIRRPRSPAAANCETRRRWARHSTTA